MARMGAAIHTEAQRTQRKAISRQGRQERKGELSTDGTENTDSNGDPVKDASARFAYMRTNLGNWGKGPG